jgi:hypothetical protein
MGILKRKRAENLSREELLVKLISENRKKVAYAGMLALEILRLAFPQLDIARLGGILLQIANS